MSGSQNRLVILGAGGHGRVVADIAEQQGFEDISFVDGNAKGRQTNLYWPIIGSSVTTVDGKFSVFIAIGNNSLRLRKIIELIAAGKTLPILIHKSASVSQYAEIGAGSVIMPQVVINAGARLGVGFIANSGCTIDHDCIIGDGVHVSPGANLAGGVSVGNCSWIGIGASIREGIRVGKNVVVGAGSVVVSDIADGEVVFGVPARTKGSVNLC